MTITASCGRQFHKLIIHSGEEDFLSPQSNTRLSCSTGKPGTLTLTLFLSSDPSVSRKASCPSVPSTRRKQFVVCPMPEGRTLSHSMALITVLFPLLVLGTTGGFAERGKDSTFSGSFGTGQMWAEQKREGLDPKPVLMRMRGACKETWLSSGAPALYPEEPGSIPANLV